MEIKPEVATIPANSDLLDGYELYWVVSRNQLEIILQDIEVFHSPPFVATAQYLGKMLPVISLEEHFGLVDIKKGRLKKYLVLKAADADQVLVRLVIETQCQVKMQRLEEGFASFGGLTLPKNNVDILGVYSLSTTAVAIVPDITGISRSLKLRGDIALQ